MPTYEYACTSCGEQLEVVQKFSDDPLTVCPACNGSLRKVFSAVGVVFKGSGFYKTDSRSTSKSKAGDKPSTTESTPAADKPAAKESSGSESSTSSKPAATESKPAGSSGDRVA
jgi:putative FmdB family regulatory protein